MYLRCKIISLICKIILNHNYVIQEENKKVGTKAEKMNFPHELDTHGKVYFFVSQNM